MKKREWGGGGGIGNIEIIGGSDSSVVRLSSWGSGFESQLGLDLGHPMHE